MRLTDAEIEAGLSALSSGWRSDGQSLHFRLSRPDFVSALKAAVDAGTLAEIHNHHPDISLGWGYCAFRLTTHDAGGLTEKDFKLAEALDGTFTA